MLRKTLTILSLLGLLLSAGLWVASYWSLEIFVGSHFYAASNACVILGRGPDAPSIRTWWMPGDAENDPAWCVHYVRPDVYWLHATSFRRFEWTVWWPDKFYDRDDAFPSVRFPIWMLVVLFGAGSFRAFVLRATRGRRRRILGLCARCAYDLRGSEHTCPECGQPFDRKLFGKKLIPGLPRVSRRVRVLIACLAVVTLSSWYWVRTADTRRAKHCAREYFRRHGGGWSLSWIDEFVVAEEKKLFWIAGWLKNEDDQESWFYLLLSFDGLPNQSDCACVIEEVDVDNEPALRVTQSAIRLDDL